MSGLVYVARPAAGRTILASRLGGAAGSAAAAAALACAGSSPDRAGLLIELADGRPPRPSLVAGAPARELEERLAVHLPDAAVASRGRICRLGLPADRGGVEAIVAALPLARESIAVVHLPPRLFRDALDEPGLGVSAVLLRADLAADRPLAGLAVRDLIERNLPVAVLKRPLGWLAGRLALAGLLPAGSAAGLSVQIRLRLVGGPDGLPPSPRHLPSQQCYSRQHDAEAEPARAPQQERRGDAGARPGGGLHRDPERGAGR